MELILEEYNTLISVQALAAALDSAAARSTSAENNLVVLDCRFSLTDTGLGNQKYATGHIPGSVYVHLDNDLAGKVAPDTGRHPLPEVSEFVQRVRNWGVSRESQVVVYDDAGGAVAGRLWWMMKWVGHHRVALLDGGYRAWQQANKPVSTHSEKTNPDVSNDRDTFTAKIDQRAAIEVGELVEQLDEGKTRLYDARSASRFAGEHEPFDPVAGHIPGAVNLPFEGNLDENGFFHTPEVLRHRFEQILDTASPENNDNNIVHMCGSGVTACHNILAMEIAGIGPTRLYVGSWSEWITDTSRAVATG
jgi:thiosulfate/3-mercaptopyruvate sulfurtransferase